MASYKDIVFWFGKIVKNNNVIGSTDGALFVYSDKRSAQENFFDLDINDAVFIPMTKSELCKKFGENKPVILDPSIQGKFDIVVSINKLQGYQM